MKKLLSVMLTLAMVLSICAVPVFAATDETVADAEALTIDDILSVPEWDGNNEVNTLIDNLNLDSVTKGETNESPITWTSSDANIISETGTVTRGTDDAEVTLTATIGSEGNVTTKDFTFFVPAASKNVNGMPTPGSEVWNDTFDGDTVVASSGYSEGYRTNAPQSTSAYAKDENGKLNLYSNVWGQEYFVRRYNTKITGKGVYEFTLGGNSNSFRLQLIDNGFTSKPLDMICYRISNKITIGTKDYMIPSQAAGENWKFTIFFDTSKDVATIWLNNKLFLEDIKMNATNDVGILNIAILASGNYDGRGSVTLDNFKAYSATESELSLDANAVSANLVEGMTYTADNGKTYLLDGLNFMKTTGTNASTISYECDSEFVASNGNLKNDVVDRDITVSATVSNEGYSVKKEFEYTIPGKYNKIGLGNHPAKDYSTLTELKFNESGEAGYSYRKHDDQTPKESIGYENGGLVYKTSGVTSTADTLYVIDSVCNKTVSEFVMENTSNGLIIKIAGGGYNKWYISHLKGSLYASKADGSAVATVDGSTTGYPVSGIMKLTLVFDFSSSIHTMDVWVNGNLVYENVPAANSSYKGYSALWVNHRTAANGFCISTGGSWLMGNGTTTIYSIKNYNPADTSALASIMKGTVSYSNGGTVVAGDNTVTLPVVATNAEGGSNGGVLIYAIYETDGGVKQLVGVKTVDMNLDEFSHREYTATVNVDSKAENFEQKVFIFDGMSTINPLSVSEFPQN